jgi:hypothetical protein
MTDKKPKKPFNLSARPPQKKANEIRDKDNADPRIKPPAMAKKPSPKLAPPGMSGITRNLATPANAKQKPKRFTPGEKGDLKKTFKPIVQSGKPKGPDIGR